MNKNVCVILQARLGSTRFPGKVIKKLGNDSLIEFMIKRLKTSKKIDEIIVAIPDSKENDELFFDLNNLNINVIRGSENDVLSRYVLAAQNTNADNLIRLTADCPLIDISIINEVIDFYQTSKADYVSNCFPPTFPDGLDVEIFKKEVLIKANSSCQDLRKREHVTEWIRDQEHLKILNFKNKQDLSFHRWTVDEPEDLEVIRNIVDFFKEENYFSWLDILKLYDLKPSLFEANRMFSRNEGMKINKGQKLWKRAKKIIPGGNMLLSKRSEMFLPEKWPSYFSKSKGCFVWDLEGQKFIDMCIMGIGTNILGYGHEEVDDAVVKTISFGNMSTLNCPEEVWLAEKLIELNPWAGKVRFARTGGEANSIAIRIARAATGKDKVAICGYHGWHDWYLATNLKNESGLSEHLLDGLQPNGVPKVLAGTVQPFSFNKFDQIKQIVNDHDLAAIKIEVQRNLPPSIEFLNGIRKLCDKNGIILIFDECTSGFRETFGGIYKKFGVEPDITIFGKALGNGYAITSIVGRDSVMSAAQETFISSTFWTERIGPSAALKTLEVMEREKSWEKITSIGASLKQSWAELAANYNLKIKLSGIPALATFNFESKHALEYKTLITQEMLKKGFLASNTCYVCIEHKPEVISQYLTALDEVFSLIKKCEEGLPVHEVLEGPVCHKRFVRLN